MSLTARGSSSRRRRSSWKRPLATRLLRTTECMSAFATVNYVDLKDSFLVNDGYYHLLSIKGDGYKHEREVRLIAKSPAFVRATADHASPSTR